MAELVASAPSVALLTSLADAGDALTRALVAHDHDAIVAATQDAGRLIAALAESSSSRNDATPAARRLGERIATGARRNAQLLERAWATDAALLRLLATAARPDAASGPAWAAAEPAGFLDRSA